MNLKFSTMVSQPREEVVRTYTGYTDILGIVLGFLLREHRALISIVSILVVIVIVLVAHLSDA